MITVRKAQERGHADHGWLDTYHTFSFADYQDAKHISWSCLRVLNEDTVAPGAGFPTHAHRDMEILTYVLDGALEHRDSMGNGSVIRPGELQRMSAGTGVTHSEHNASKNDPVHFLQVWILPERRGLLPGYEQRIFPETERRDRLRIVASQDGREGSLVIHQDAAVFATLLQRGRAVGCELIPGRNGYLHVARGRMRVQGTPLAAGDGARLEGEPVIRIEAVEDAEALFFDLPA